MNYKRVVAYIPDTSVLFELDNGNFALVSYDDYTGKTKITVSKYAESHLKFGGFEDGAKVPKQMLKKATEILGKGENVFECKDLKLNKK